MSKATKRKHVVHEVMNEYVLPSNNQQIVRVIVGKGNNLHKVEAANGETFLCSMPVKFRKNVWIKRGDYIIVEPIEEGDKVKAEIIKILYQDQIKYIKEQGFWPSGFNDNREEQISAQRNPYPENSDDSDSDLFVNTNHPNITYSSETSTEGDSSDSYEEDEISNNSSDKNHCDKL